jgi:hypothetical protein
MTAFAENGYGTLRPGLLRGQNGTWGSSVKCEGKFSPTMSVILFRVWSNGN